MVSSSLTLQVAGKITSCNSALSFRVVSSTLRPYYRMRRCRIEDEASGGRNSFGCFLLLFALLFSGLQVPPVQLFAGFVSLDG